MLSALWVVVRGVSLGEAPEQKNEKTMECGEHSPCKVGGGGPGRRRAAGEKGGQSQEVKSLLPKQMLWDGVSGAGPKRRKVGPKWCLLNLAARRSLETLAREVCDEIGHSVLGGGGRDGRRPSWSQGPRSEGKARTWQPGGPGAGVSLVQVERDVSMFTGKSQKQRLSIQEGGWV